jgi:hypothetical protein
MRAQVDDGLAPIIGTCVTQPFDVDNTTLCLGLCGDCDGSGYATTILDGLAAAQIAAGLVQPTASQLDCCDVDASFSITVLDALRIAQDSAGIPLTLGCP